MKSTVKMLVAIITVAVLGTACSKKEITPEAVVNQVAVETSLKAGETYNLDLSAYSSKNTRVTITKQPVYASESVLTPGTCQSAGSYRYTAGSAAASDQVVLRLVKGGKCNKPEETTDLTITVKTIEDVPVVQE